MESILFVVAHPDDVSNGMGGTAYLLKDKYNLFVVCLTKGERGCKGWSLNKAASVREKEEAAACSLLGADLRFCNRIDREVYANAKICREIARLVSEMKPVAIFTLWPIDSHPDHSAVAEIVKKAAFMADIPLEIIYCEEAEGQTSHFVPDFYVDISRVMDEKLKMIRCHKSQNKNDAMAKAFLKKSVLRGKESNLPNAEGFRVLFHLKSGCESVLSSIGAKKSPHSVAKC